MFSGTSSRCNGRRYSPLPSGLHGPTSSFATISTIETLGATLLLEGWGQLADARIYAWAKREAWAQVKRNLSDILGPDAAEPAQIIVHEQTRSGRPRPVRFSFTATTMHTTAPTSPKTKVEPFDILVPWSRRFLDSVAAWIQIATRTRYFTEYALPYVVAASPVVYLLAIHLLPAAYETIAGMLRT